MRSGQIPSLINHTARLERPPRPTDAKGTPLSVLIALGKPYALYAELLKRKGDLAGAKEKLGKAIEIYRECGAEGWLKKAQQDLAGLPKTG